MYNEDGETTWQRSLNSNGAVKTGDNSACPFFYQGQYYDAEIELAYNRFRYYSPDTGTYISQDPIGLASGEPIFYAYVSDVNSHIDIFGLNCSAAQRKANKTNGKKAEDLVHKKLLANPDIEVLGRNVYIKTPGVGRGRYVDILAQNKKTGKLINVEVKSGNATRSAKQVAKDDIINSGNGIFGKNAPLDMNGNELAGELTNDMTTSVSNVPLWKL